jgi:hypothetical protein
MANYDLRKDSSTGFGAVARPRLFVTQRTLSVNATNYVVPGTSVTSNAITLAQSVTSNPYNLRTVGAGDTVQLVSVPAGALVLDVRLEVLTLGTGNLSVGDSSSATKFMAATSIGSTGFKTMAATPGIAFYSTADYIYVTFASANDGATTSQTPVVKLTVIWADHSNHREAQTFVP